MQKVFSQRHPRLLWLVQHSDNVFLILLLLLENHHLKHYDASFAENFYGMKRVRVQHHIAKDGKRVKTLAPITSWSRYSALFFLVGMSGFEIQVISKVVVPYCKNKLDEYYKRLIPQLSLIRREQEEQDIESVSMVVVACLN